MEAAAEGGQPVTVAHTDSCEARSAPFIVVKYGEKNASFHFHDVLAPCRCNVIKAAARAALKCAHRGRAGVSAPSHRFLMELGRATVVL